jgi:hypothetical protein
LASLPSPRWQAMRFQSRCRLHGTNPVPLPRFGRDRLRADISDNSKQRPA